MPRFTVDIPAQTIDIDNATDADDAVEQALNDATATADEVPDDDDEDDEDEDEDGDDDKGSGGGTTTEPQDIPATA